MRNNQMAYSIAHAPVSSGPLEHAELALGKGMQPEESLGRKAVRFVQQQGMELSFTTKNLL